MKNVHQKHLERTWRKPNEIRKQIVELYGDIPRIELFAREQLEGFDVWGNETNKFNKP